MLKIIIVLLLLGVIASLTSGLVFLFKDTDQPDSKRTLYALGIRITLAGLLLSTIAYGFYTGELRMGVNAPWHAAQAASE
ncbi:MAG: DUF2909 domain-containing protein [Pseudomonadota bacterium]|nr:DUF2909 domain-containing protein [Pseudomonadota bacterium]